MQVFELITVRSGTKVHIHGLLLIVGGVSTPLAGSSMHVLLVLVQWDVLRMYELRDSGRIVVAATGYVIINQLTKLVGWLVGY